MKHSLTSEILSVARFGNDCRAMEIDCAGISREAKPGQFVQVKGWSGNEPLLRRPISIAGASDGKLLLWIRNVGPGSRLITGHEPGETLEVVGPLGTGFTPPAPGELIYMVAGTLGAAPLRFYSEMFGAGAQLRFFYGGACECDLDLLSDSVLSCVPSEVATEDGCSGCKGLVTDVLGKAVSERKPDRIITCGPHGMMKAVARMAAGAGVRCEVSLDSYMSCGFGACMGCVVPAADPEKKYLHTCTDGPVFDSSRINWEAF